MQATELDLLSTGGSFQRGEVGGEEDVRDSVYVTDLLCTVFP